MDSLTRELLWHTFRDALLLLLPFYRLAQRAWRRRMAAKRQGGHKKKITGHRNYGAAEGDLGVRLLREARHRPTEDGLRTCLLLLLSSGIV